jgi:uncharacterized protein YndB with AHSA1/START domain
MRNELVPRSALGREKAVTMYALALMIMATIGSPREAPNLAPLVHKGIVNAALQKVWVAFTTKEGMESWMVAHAEMDLRVGGKMRTHYRKEGVLGDAGTIENRILSFDPERMISIQVARAPNGFPFPKAIESMWTVVYFEPAGTERTRVTIRGLGWTADSESQRMRRFFDAGNRQTLDALIAHFANRSPAPKNGTEIGGSGAVELPITGRLKSQQRVHEVRLCGLAEPASLGSGLAQGAPWGRLVLTSGFAGMSRPGASAPGKGGATKEGALQRR